MPDILPSVLHKSSIQSLHQSYSLCLCYPISLVWELRPKVTLLTHGPSKISRLRSVWLWSQRLSFIYCSLEPIFHPGTSYWLLFASVTCHLEERVFAFWGLRALMVAVASWTTAAAPLPQLPGTHLGASDSFTTSVKTSSLVKVLIEVFSICSFVIL